MSEPVEPSIPALEAWYARPNCRPLSDRADVTVRMPEAAPTAILQTHTVGLGDGSYEELWDEAHPMVTLNIAGVSIVHYLADLEQFIDAARDALKVTRYYADRLIVENAERAGVSL